MIDFKETIKRCLSDKLYLAWRYYRAFGTLPDFKNPKTFNEKLQWLKLYDRNSIYSTMVDKFEAKEYVAKLIGDQYIIPTIGAWDSFEDIDFDELPDRFVLKCTHDSGCIAICRNKMEFDKKSAREKLERGLKNNYFWRGREWPYKNLKPRIIAEQYMEDEKNKGELSDYKVHNFNGEPKIILVCGNRFSNSGLTEDFYSDTWEHLDMKRPKHPNAEVVMEKPEKISQILEFSRILSKGIPFIRTDFYIVNNKIYFGELTFFPASGFERFEPEECDQILGSWLTLPSEKIL